MGNNNNNKAKDNTLFGNIKSDYIIRDIFEKIKENKMLKIIKYNKSIQKRLNKDINIYKFYFFKNEGFNIKFIGGNTKMSEEIKKIEELEGFKNMRIVDNFYQTSSFFPMPTIEISTLDEKGQTNKISTTQIIER